MKAIRRPQLWFGILMWVLSGIIAALLIQLGALIMSDVPKAGKKISREDFVNSEQLALVESEIVELQRQINDTNNEIEDARFLLRSQKLDYTNQLANFENWIATRSATESDSQNADVVKRVTAIEILKNEERKTQRAIEELNVGVVKVKRILSDEQAEKREILDDASVPYREAKEFAALIVFGIRLAFTLPLILISGWLVYKRRKSKYWPIYRGFVIFALFGFFVELVPYMPSYGGYIRYVAGLLIAFLITHVSIKWMAQYLENKKAEEMQPEVEKRKTIAYETAVKKISNGQCPSCDRHAGAKRFKLKKDDQETHHDFCVHCGFCLYKKCDSCGNRENSFYKFCGVCGSSSEGKDAEPAS